MTRCQHGNLILNEPCSVGFMILKPPFEPEQIYPIVDRLVGTQVDVFSFSLSRGGDNYGHRSKVAPWLRAADDVWEGADSFWKFGLMYRNQIAVQEAGWDPLSVVVERAHENGLRLWGAFRMNEIHEDWPEAAVYRSDFKKEHPELLLGSPYPEPHVRGNLDSDFCWGWNYAMPEVRERRLAVIEEVANDYDVDGIELDFMRHTFYFKTEERELGMPLMNDFMQQVRQVMDRASERKGRPLTLAVRVDRNFAENRALGLDVLTWIEEELADLLIPMDCGRMDMQADVKGFVEAARNTRCEIAGGIENRTYGPYGYLADDDTDFWRFGTLPMLRAAALGYYRQGAGSIYLYNYLYIRDHTQVEPDPDAYARDAWQALSEIGAPEEIEHKSKCYTVTVDPIPLYTGALASDRMQLPRVLEHPGDSLTFTLFVGDELETARQDGILDSVRLRITAQDFRYPGDALTVRLNGEVIESIRYPWRPLALIYDDVPARLGENSVTIVLEKRRPGRPEPIQLQGLELLILYEEH